MRASALTGVAAAATALAVVLSGCGSDTKTATSSSSTESKSSSSTTSTSKKPKVPETTQAEAAGPNPTIADYIKENSIQETGIKMGDPNAPAVNLPVPSLISVIAEITVWILPVTYSES